MEQVSRLFETHLGKTYDPELCWTSSLRTRAGLRPCPPATDYVPAFTIEDHKREFQKFLAKKGLNIPTSRSVSHLRFHIDVVTVEGELEGSQFFLHPKQLKHVRFPIIAIGMDWSDN
jgi:hypothetical protein